MEPQLQRPRDIIGGLVIVAVGALFLLLGRELEFGNSFQMGPGYFPSVLSVLTMILGGVLTWKGLRGAPVEGAFSHIPWIGVVSVIGSVVFFGLTIRGIGIAPAVAVVVFVTASASRYARWTTLAPARGRDGDRLHAALRLRPRPAAADLRSVAVDRTLVARRRPSPRSRRPERWNCFRTWRWASVPRSIPSTCSTASSACCSAPRSACCPASGRWRRSPCCCR